MARMTVLRRIIVVILLICTVFNTLCIGVYASGSAATEYSDVLDDLKKDPNFSIDSYPLKEGDYSLNFMQLSEGENGSIFLYFYKPSGRNVEFSANKVNMSNTGTAEGVRPYDLTLLSEWGPFQKYKVEGLTVPEGTLRRYLLVCVYRPFDVDLGDTATGNGTIDVSKALPIEVIWSAVTASDGSVTYAAEYTEDTIQVTSSCLGDIYYPEGGLGAILLTADSAIESFYFAFSTNKPIDVIHNAYIEYSYVYEYQDASGLIYIDESEEGDKIVELKKDDLFKVPNGSIFGGDYEYARIQTTEAFLKNEGFELSDTVKAAIGAEKWILRFCETSYLHTQYPYYKYLNTDITAVNLFRLRYEYKNEIYDVGVVADIKAPDNIHDGYGVSPPGLWDWLLKLLRIILLVVLLIVLFPLIQPVVSILVWIISEAVKVVIWIVTLPFELISRSRDKKK